jgi:hypothetical protein
MAQRISLGSFIVTAVFLRFGWNSPFFQFNTDAFSGDQFLTLFYYMIALFVSEFISTSIITVMVRCRYGLVTRSQFLISC